MKKYLMIDLVLILICLLLVGCGSEDSNKNIENVEAVEKKDNNFCNIPEDTIYEILEVRENVYAYNYESFSSYKNVDVFYIISILLEDSEGERFYLSYESKDTKNNQYLLFAKAMKGDSLEFDSSLNRFEIYFNTDKEDVYENK